MHHAVDFQLIVHVGIIVFGFAPSTPVYAAFYEQGGSGNEFLTECFEALAEESHRVVSVEVFDIDVGEWFLGLVEPFGNGTYQTGQADLHSFLLCRAILYGSGEHCQVYVAEVVHFEPVGIQRMGRKVHIHEFLFLVEQFHIVERQGFRNLRLLRFDFLRIAEEGADVVFIVAAQVLAVAYKGLQKGIPVFERLEIDAAAYIETVQGSGINKRLIAL